MRTDKCALSAASDFRPGNASTVPLGFIHLHKLKKRKHDIVSAMPEMGLGEIEYPI